MNLLTTQLNLYNKSNSKELGFTLIELMIVVAIISILATLSLPKFEQFRAKTYNMKAQKTLVHLDNLGKLLVSDFDESATGANATAMSLFVYTGGKQWADSPIYGTGNTNYTKDMILNYLGNLATDKNMVVQFHISKTVGTSYLNVYSLSVYNCEGNTRYFYHHNPSHTVAELERNLATIKTEPISGYHRFHYCP